jgi:DNA (cytosine-5)-methyltransferase 1
VIGSVCSGYGGLELGVRLAWGGSLAWHCEIDLAASRVLAHRFPGVPNLGDITAVDWADAEPVDVLCGGTPCQDLSHAGTHAGMHDGTRSGLWAAMREAVATIRPSVVVWENVRGAYSADADSALEPCPWCVGNGPATGLRALGRVLGDLADLGYDARWCGVRAADAGAPHERFRVFVVAAAENADSESIRGIPRAASGQEESGRSRTDVGRRSVAPAADSVREGLQGRREPRRGLGDRSTWGDYEPAIRRWETVLGRAAPEPTEPATRGGRRLSARFVEWMMGLDDGWVTAVPGINRTAQLRMLGNGVVPQQAALALRTAEAMAA